MIPENVNEELKRQGLTALEFEEGSTPTAETAAARIGVAVGQIAKSLLFRGKSGRFYLAVCPGDRRVSSSKMKRLAGEKVSMATAEETEAAVGYRPGGVCPFCIPETIAIFLDSGLASYETVYPAAGTDASGVPMTYGKLLEITRGTPADLVSEDGEKQGSNP
jgi:prolyl-tRNA editing enzyme YbaK/EbsC (Cys-tRNA(Pro) deacylase)